MRCLRTSLIGCALPGTVRSVGGSALVMLLLAAIPSHAAAPRCGVFDESSGRVTVTSTGEQFTVSELLNAGRFSGRGAAFGCWIEIGSSDDIRGTLMYAYRITDPSGESKEFGPYGIQAGGFGSTGAIPVPGYKQPVGTWTVEFLTVRRDNGAKASLGTVSFKMIGAPSAGGAGPGAQCGVFEESSGRVTVAATGGQFSVSRLLNEGRFSGRGPGFGCWIEMGTSDQVRGTLMYGYRIADPRGESTEFGPYGIQAGGFGSASINPTLFKQAVGAWTIEFISIRRDNGAKASVGSASFTLVE